MAASATKAPPPRSAPREDADVAEIRLVVKRMQDSVGNAQAQAKGCEALMEICSKGDELRSALGQQGAVAAVVRAMQSHRSSVDVQREGCRAIGGIAHHLGNLPLIAKAGGIEAVVTAMQTHADVEQVQSGGCRALGGIAVHIHNQPMVAGKAGGIEAVVKAMKSHPSSVQVQVAGCIALAVFFVYRSNRPAIIRMHGMELVKSALDWFSDKAPCREAARRATETLGVFAASQGIRAALTEGETGIHVMLLLAGVENYAEGLAATFLSALAEYAQDPVCHPFFLSSGVSAISTVAKALISYSSNCRLQLCGVRVLYDLARGSDEGRKALQAEKDIARALSVACDLLCRGAAGALSELTTEERSEGEEKVEALERMATTKATTKAPLAAAAKIERLLEKMRDNAGDAAVQAQGCSALREFAHEDTLSRSLVGELGGVDAVLHAMELHPSSVDVQWKACWALAKLAAHRDNHPLVVEAGGMKIVLNAMRSNPGSTDLQESGCAALVSITDDRDCQPLVTAGGIDVVMRALQSHPHNAALQGHGCRVMGRIARRSGGLHQATKAGGIEAVVSAMKAHASSEDVQLCGCFALGEFAEYPDCNALVAKAGGIQAVIRAMQAHPGSYSVQHYGCRAFFSIGANPENRLAIARQQGLELVKIALIQYHSIRSFAGRMALYMLAASKGNRVGLPAEEVADGIRWFVERVEINMEEKLEEKFTFLWLNPLTGYTSDPACHAVLLSAGAVPTVSRAMIKHAPSCRVQLCGVRVLSDLARGSAGGKAAITEALPVVQRALAAARNVLSGGSKAVSGLTADELREATERLQALSAVTSSSTFSPAPTGVAGAQGAAAAAAFVSTVSSSPDYEAAKALLAGLDVSRRTIEILAHEDYTTAGSLRHISLEELTGLGIALGQARVIKLKFRNDGSGGGASQDEATAPNQPSPHNSSSASPPSQVSTSTFGASNFKRIYDSLRPVEVHYRLFEALHQLIVNYCRVHAQDTTKGDAFFSTLSKVSFGSPDLLLEEVDAASQLMWTTKERLRGCGRQHHVELCSILNHAIRTDHPDLVPAAAQLARNINRLCVTRRKDAPKFPPNAISFRGSSLPDKHRGFFTIGKKYRVPGFLATSFDEAVAFGFLIGAHDDGAQPVVLWRVHFDPRGAADPRFRCRQVNYVNNSNVKGEEEYLFAPYSTFTVRAVEWNAGDDRRPHVIDIEASLDNRDEPEDLPLAPWY